MTKENWENLATAIVEQAIEDYKSCIRWAETGQEVIYTSNGKLTIEEVYSLYISCRTFFLGDWIKALTAIKGEYILRSLEEQVGIIEGGEEMEWTR